MILREYTGIVVAVNDKLRLGRRQIRIPDIHGGKFSTSETGFEAPYIANADLPWAMVGEIPGYNPNVAGHNVSYDAGQLVKIVFTDQEYEDIPGQFPVIVNTAPKPDATKTPTVMTPLGANPANVVPVTVTTTSGVSNNPSVRLPSVNPCGENEVPPGLGLPNKTIGTADGKCGQQSKIDGTFAENIADFLYFVQNTNGQIGSSLVDKYTGELATSLNYVQKYTGAILGIFRDGLSWIKAIITKYASMAIDKLVKAIMTPIKGVLEPVQKVFEDILNKIGCTLGDIEATLANMIEELLLALLNSALDAVFGCLDTLVDGFLNEILSQVSELCDLIFSSIEAISSLVGDLGDIAGEAIAAVLSFLGITCGGAGDCTKTKEKSFTNKLFSNDGYKIPYSAFDTGLAAITGISQGILTGANGVNALNAETAALQAGQTVGASSSYASSTFAGQPIENTALKNALGVAESLLPTGDIFSWCDSVAAAATTTAVVIGTPETKYDTKYSIFNGASVDTGGTATFTIYRDNVVGPGVIIVLGYKAADDNVRISGGGLVGDVTNTASFTNSDFVADSSLPSSNSVFFYQKITFAKDESQKTVTIQTNNNTPINNTTAQVQYTMGVFRAADDVTLDSTYQGIHEKHPNSSLNSCKGLINFQLPTTPIVATSGSTTTPTLNTTISGISPTASGSANNCIPEILITAQPPPTYTAVNGDVVSLGVAAKPTVAGYTINYQWQSSTIATTGFTNVDATSPGNIITKTTTASSITQVFGIVSSGFTTTGSGYVFSGWTDQVTLTGITQTYSGAVGTSLTINPISIFVNNNEYYRVVLTSSGLPTKTTSVFKIIVVASGTFQYGTTASGNTFTNSGNTATTSTTVSSVYCTPYVYPVASGVVVLSGVTTTSGTSTTASGTTSGGSTTPPVTPITGITTSGTTNTGPWIAPVVVNNNGQVVSIQLPTNLPKFKSEPIISISGSGAGATAKAILDEDNNLKSILVKSGGFGYTPNNTLKRCPILTDIQVTAPGYYYATTPTVYVNGDSSIAVADIDPTTTILKAIRIVNPQNLTYDSPPRIEVMGGEGIGARAKAIITYVDCTKIQEEYDKVVNSYKLITREPVKVIDCP